jgi:hypothetical protein
MLIDPILLVVTGAVCAVMGAVAVVFIRRELLPRPEPARVESAHPAPAGTAAPSTRELDPDDPMLLAVLAAAASTMLGQPARVMSVRLEPNYDTMRAWSTEGRRQVFSSRSVR